MILSLAAMAVLLIGVFVDERARGLLAGLTLVGIALAFLASLTGRGPGDPNAMVVGDGFATFFTFVILIVAAITVFLSNDYVASHPDRLGEFYALLPCCSAGI